MHCEFIEGLPLPSEFHRLAWCARRQRQNGGGQPFFWKDGRRRWFRLFKAWSISAQYSNKRRKIQHLTFVVTEVRSSRNSRKGKLKCRSIKENSRKIKKASIGFGHS